MRLYQKDKKRASIADTVKGEGVRHKIMMGPDKYQNPPVPFPTLALPRSGSMGLTLRSKNHPKGKYTPQKTLKNRASVRIITCHFHQVKSS